MENCITIKELVEKTGFSKKQIYNWQKVGIIPEAIERVKTGRREGEVVYYPMESFIRLNSLKNLPISSITRTVGSEGLFLPLFLFGFIDKEIRSGIKKLYKKAFKYLGKTLEKKGKNVEDVWEEGSTIPFLFKKVFGATPELTRLISLKLSGLPNKELKKILTSETSNSEYDILFNDGQKLINLIISHFSIRLIEEKKVAMIDILLDSIKKLVPQFPSLGEINQLIKQLTKEDFKILQAITIMILGLFISLGISRNEIIELLRKKSALYGICLLSIYGLIIHKYFSPNIPFETKRAILAIPNKCLQTTITLAEANFKTPIKKLFIKK